MGLFQQYLDYVQEDNEDVPVRGLFIDARGIEFSRTFPNKFAAISWAKRTGYGVKRLAYMQDNPHPVPSLPQPKPRRNSDELIAGDRVMHGLLGACTFKRYDGSSAVVADRTGKLCRVPVTSLQSGGVEEAAYVGNVGAMEMAKFYQQATPEQKSHLKQLIASAQSKPTLQKQIWDFVFSVIGGKRLIGKDFN